MVHECLNCRCNAIMKHNKTRVIREGKQVTTRETFICPVCGKETEITFVGGVEYTYEIWEKEYHNEGKS